MGKMIRLCIAGITGQVGASLVKHLEGNNDFKLVCGISRSSSGKTLNEVFPGSLSEARIFGTLEDSFCTSYDVLIDYTSAHAVKRHVHAVLEKRIPIVVGSSGLTNEDFIEIEALATKNDVGVIAAGNFSITAAMLLKASELVAKQIPYWECIDYGRASKPDAPSGTSLELLNTLSKFKSVDDDSSLLSIVGDIRARGAVIDGQHAHSVRLPGFHSGVEIIFSLAGERLSIKHESISNEPYVSGTLLAAKKVLSVKGLVRGMPKILEL